MLIFRLFALTASFYFIPCHSDSFAISGNPGAFTFSSAIAGSQPAPQSNASTTYSVTTILVTRDVLGSVSTSMPTGVTLAISLQAPIGGSSLGNVTMTTTPQTLVSSINILTIQGGLTITYTMTVTTAAAQGTNKTATVTYTLQ